MILHPSISPEIFTLRLDFVALSIAVKSARNGIGDPAPSSLLDQACRELEFASWADEHLQAWDEAYRAFGAKPKRSPCSATALRKRAARDGALSPVNAVVDIYNAISVKFAIPVGGEDAIAYQGAPRLLRATGEEHFDTIDAGIAKTDFPEPGEVVWCDNQGVTCRRWNWRQGVRTRITEESSALWFVLERLDPMPIERLIDAGSQLVAGLTQYAAAHGISARLLDAEHPEGREIRLDQ